GQVNTRLPNDTVNKQQTITDKGLGIPKTPDEMKSFLDAGVDPYFVETEDPFSTKGPQCIVRNLIQDKAGNLWLATWHGIIKYDGTTFTNYTLKEGLIHFHVTTLFEDSKGNIWFGTARGGVYRYDGRSFTLYTTKNGMIDNTANCIAEDKNGNIWIGTEKGASRFDGKTFIHFTSEDGLSDNYVNAILKDKTGMIWFGTKNGINRYDGKSFATFTDKNKLPFKQVASLFEDKNGNIWIGSGSEQAGGKGLCQYNGKSVRTSISPYYVMYMCQDKKGNLWLAHNKGSDNVNFALYCYDGKLFTKIIEQNKTDNPVIFGIIEDKSGNIWFGTTKGVCRYDGKSFNTFTE
ncbi:MAG TPA: two-component regulator propeller domain-containing protein, partial [Bacteroidia bacterium]|nr:two-component regulator propeller domain-containing protein [Bacteroidia bacterium]